MRQDTAPIETSEQDDAATDLVEAVSENPVANNALQTFRDLMDGDVTRADLLGLWAHVGLPIAKVVLLIIAVLLVSGWMRRLVEGACRRAKIEQTLARFFGNIAKWGVMILGGVTILQTFGIEATSFAAVLASVGFAIGLALSGLLGGVAAGVMLLIFRPFRAGDFIKAAGESGTVEELGLFTVTLKTPDNRQIIVPNGEIFGNNIENVTAYRLRRADVTVGTEYSADLDQTREVLMAAARAVEGGLDDPEPVVYLDELGGSSINWKVRLWTQTSDYWAVKERLTREVKIRLDEADIGIPFPQMDVHVDGRLGKPD